MAMIFHDANASHVGKWPRKMAVTKTSAPAEANQQRRRHQRQRTTTNSSAPRDPGPNYSDTANVASREGGIANSDRSDGMLVEDDFQAGRQPPAKKKRKLSIRTSSHHAYAYAHAHAHAYAHHQPETQHSLHQHAQAQRQQSTLDAFLASTHNLGRQEPPAPLQQTLNGLRSTLVAADDDDDDDDDDELLRPSPKPARIRLQAAARPSKSPVPQPPQKQEEKRSLRSRDEGPRLKSELAVYFPNYEDIMFDVPKAQDFVTTDTVLYITDDAKKEDASPTKAPSHVRKVSANGAAGPPPHAALQRSLSNHFNGSPSLNLDFVSKNLPENPEDPLTHDHFLKSHKRAERKEKQLRNIERERAMHEKVQLDRLLDGLLGHDWLRVLGITGVTETEAKKYEPKRNYFIAEVQALVDKFKQWKDQEKKLRLEKEAAQAAKDAEDEEADTTEGSVEPPSSDLNASAVRPLQQETVNSLRAKASGNGKKRVHASGYASTSYPTTPATPAPIKLILPPAPPSPELPITSFYAKPHLRDAALSKTRHGRNVTAFGLPLPEMEEKDFELPSDYITADALKASARERRRRKRESAANTSGSK
ncbi:hypothetical protein AC579_1430 [Pseudocercospora musae]|uniref:Something about silencing protein 4 domain-containing protein n=1 Tax=Pseudocercospora musae TaxID=113226 RepID=A0A139IMZ9_9PEZI|nr:hypothetical protein AC579_1430 [Pseudocercospora musae]